MKLVFLFIVLLALSTEVIAARSRKGPTQREKKAQVRENAAEANEERKAKQVENAEEWAKEKARAKECKKDQKPLVSDSYEPAKADFWRRIPTMIADKRTRRELGNFFRDKIFPSKTEPSTPWQDTINELQTQLAILKEDMVTVQKTFDAYCKARGDADAANKRLHEQSPLLKKHDLPRCGDSLSDDVYKPPYNTYSGKGGVEPHGKPVSVRAKWFTTHYEMTEAELKTLCCSLIDYDANKICGDSVSMRETGFHYKETKDYTDNLKDYLGQAMSPMNCHAKFT